MPAIASELGLSPDWITLHLPFVELFLQAMQDVPRETLKFQYQALQEHDTWDLLPTVSTPTLIIHSREDLIIPTANAPLLSARIPGAAAMLLSAETLSLPMDNARLSPVDIEDIAQIAFKLLRDGGHEGECFNLTGPESLTMVEVAERISQATGRAVSYVNLTLEKFRSALLATGTSPERADAFVELWSERRKCSTSRVDLEWHRMFGVQPATFLEFARRNAAVLRGEPLA